MLKLNVPQKRNFFTFWHFKYNLTFFFIFKLKEELQTIILNFFKFCSYFTWEEIILLSRFYSFMVSMSHIESEETGVVTRLLV